MRIDRLRAGRRSIRILFQRTADPIDDGYTVQLGPWTDFCLVWASVAYGTGQERREAAQLSASTPATFSVLTNSKTRSLSVTDRIVFNGGNWDITSVVPVGSAGEGLDITAVRAAQ